MPGVPTATEVAAYLRAHPGDVAFVQREIANPHRFLLGNVQPNPYPYPGAGGGVPHHVKALDALLLALREGLALYLRSQQPPTPSPPSPPSPQPKPPGGPPGPSPGPIRGQPPAKPPIAPAPQPTPVPSPSPGPQRPGYYLNPLRYQPGQPPLLPIPVKQPVQKPGQQPGQGGGTQLQIQPELVRVPSEGGGYRDIPQIQDPSHAIKTVDPGGTYEAPALPIPVLAPATAAPLAPVLDMAKPCAACSALSATRDTVEAYPVEVTLHFNNHRLAEEIMGQCETMGGCEIV